MDNRKRSSGTKQGYSFGTFGGVFTPSVLTIIGVIMFLRFNVVVGYAGLWNALLILAASKAITVITALSLSSISTNMRVKGGGAYYLISRSLGPEFGGVIAVFFYIAQTVAVTMYIIGFTEAVFSAFPNIPLSFRDVATLSNFIVFLVVYIGANWTIRVQYWILALMMLSILSFFIGGALGFSPEILQSNLAPEWKDGHSLFTIFALFFPAVTGIMAGVNMSGDLKDPSRSIPRGTFAAIGATGLIYALVTFLLAGSVPRAELISDGFVMKDRALFSPLIYAGVFCATLSSALGSMMGAPRILQAFARDDVFRGIKWLGRGSGKNNEPRFAIALTFVIAQAGIMVGDLDTVAPVITMFFLMTYGTVNLACFYEFISRNPSFRPTFRINHWIIALAGAVGCLVVMFLINAFWAFIAILLALLLYSVIRRIEIMVKWGDMQSGLAYQRARNALLRLEQERYHPKNWRPTILALSGGAYNRIHLAEYACWLSASHGIVSIGQVIRGNLDNLVARQREAEFLLRKFIREEGLNAFPAVVVDKNIHAGVQGMLQCHGLGGLRPNTLLLGWSQDAEKSEVFFGLLTLAKRMERSIVIVANKALDKEAHTVIADGAINIWWNNERDASLLLLLAYLLKKNSEWRTRPIRILRPVPYKADVMSISAAMREMLEGARIEAEIVILPCANPTFAVRTAMQPSAVLFASFDPPDEDNEAATAARMKKIVALPGDVLLVYNAGYNSLQA
ncbi:MAG TPA: amino acid permease [Kiritimatiellia bacterium]|jgi:amino acid transporter|nr:amino acid permease [Kiritimatiellia bacterium]HOR97261.1 amino acid permease [Kiritimatiellia bacterium]HRU19235.1 amino acid permease [Kiritimatiellia bacterium]